MNKKVLVSSLFGGTVTTTSISLEETTRDFLRVAVKKHHKEFPRTKECELAAAINLTKIRVLRPDLKLKSQIQTGGFVWLVSRDEWESFENHLNSKHGTPTRYGRTLPYRSPASLSPQQLHDFVTTFCCFSKLNMQSNLSEVEVLAVDKAISQHRTLLSPQKKSSTKKESSHESQALQRDGRQAVHAGAHHNEIDTSFVENQATVNESSVEKTCRPKNVDAEDEIVKARDAEEYNAPQIKDVTPSEKKETIDSPSTSTRYEATSNVSDMSGKLPESSLVSRLMCDMERLESAVTPVMLSTDNQLSSYARPSSLPQANLNESSFNNIFHNGRKQEDFKKEVLSLKGIIQEMKSGQDELKKYLSEIDAMNKNLNVVKKLMKLQSCQQPSETRDIVRHNNQSKKEMKCCDEYSGGDENADTVGLNLMNSRVVNSDLKASSTSMTSSNIDIITNIPDLTMSEVSNGSANNNVSGNPQFSEKIETCTTETENERNERVSNDDISSSSEWPNSTGENHTGENHTNDVIPPPPESYSPFHVIRLNSSLVSDHDVNNEQLNIHDDDDLPNELNEISINGIHDGDCESESDDNIISPDNPREFLTPMRVSRSLLFDPSSVQEEEFEELEARIAREETSTFAQNETTNEKPDVSGPYHEVSQFHLDSEPNSNMELTENNLDLIDVSLTSTITSQLDLADVGREFNEAASEIREDKTEDSMHSFRMEESKHSQDNDTSLEDEQAVVRGQPHESCLSSTEDLASEVDARNDPDKDDKEERAIEDSASTKVTMKLREDVRGGADVEARTIRVASPPRSREEIKFVDVVNNEPQSSIVTMKPRDFLQNSHEKDPKVTAEQQQQQQQQQEGRDSRMSAAQLGLLGGDKVNTFHDDSSSAAVKMKSRECLEAPRPDSIKRDDKETSSEESTCAVVRMKPREFTQVETKEIFEEENTPSSPLLEKGEVQGEEKEIIEETSSSVVIMKNCEDFQRISGEEGAAGVNVFPTGEKDSVKEVEGEFEKSDAVMKICKGLHSTVDDGKENGAVGSEEAVWDDSRDNDELESVDFSPVGDSIDSILEENGVDDSSTLQAEGDNNFQEKWSENEEIAGDNNDDGTHVYHLHSADTSTSGAEHSDLNPVANDELILKTSGSDDSSLFSGAPDKVECNEDEDIISQVMEEIKHSLALDTRDVGVDSAGTNISTIDGARGELVSTKESGGEVKCKGATVQGAVQLDEVEQSSDDISDSPNVDISYTAQDCPFDIDNDAPKTSAVSVLPSPESPEKRNNALSDSLQDNSTVLNQLGSQLRCARQDFKQMDSEIEPFKENAQRGDGKEGLRGDIERENNDFQSNHTCNSLHLRVPDRPATLKHQLSLQLQTARKDLRHVDLDAKGAEVFGELKESGGFHSDVPEASHHNAPDDYTPPAARPFPMKSQLSMQLQSVRRDLRHVENKSQNNTTNKSIVVSDDNAGRGGGVIQMRVVENGDVEEARDKHEKSLVEVSYDVNSVRGNEVLASRPAPMKSQLSIQLQSALQDLKHVRGEEKKRQHELDTMQSKVVQVLPLPRVDEAESTAHSDEVTGISFVKDDSEGTQDSSSLMQQQLNENRQVLEEGTVEKKGADGNGMMDEKDNVGSNVHMANQFYLADEGDDGTDMANGSETRDDASSNFKLKGIFGSVDLDSDTSPISKQSEFALSVSKSITPFTLKEEESATNQHKDLTENNQHENGMKLESRPSSSSSFGKSDMAESESKTITPFSSKKIGSESLSQQNNLEAYGNKESQMMEKDVKMLEQSSSKIHAIVSLYRPYFHVIECQGKRNSQSIAPFRASESNTCLMWSVFQCYCKNETEIVSRTIKATNLLHMLKESGILQSGNFFTSESTAAPERRSSTARRASTARRQSLASVTSESQRPSNIRRKSSLRRDSVAGSNIFDTSPPVWDRRSHLRPFTCQISPISSNRLFLELEKLNKADDEARTLGADHVISTNNNISFLVFTELLKLLTELCFPNFTDNEDDHNPSEELWCYGDYLHYQFFSDQTHFSSQFADLPSSQILSRITFLLLATPGNQSSGLFSSPFPKYASDEAYAVYVSRGYHNDDALLLPTPFQEESVFKFPPSVYLQRMNAAGQTSALFQIQGKKPSFMANCSGSDTAPMKNNMFGLWEQNIDQMKSIYAFYAQEGGALRRESITANSMRTALSALHSQNAIAAAAVSTSRQKDCSMLDFDKCKCLLHNFQIFPKHVDLKTVQALFRFAKQWEWSWAEEKLEEYSRSATNITSCRPRQNVRGSISFLTSENPSVNKNSSSSSTASSFPHKVERKLSGENESYAFAISIKEIRKSQSTTFLTFRGFIEFMTRLALYLNVHNLDSGPKGRHDSRKSKKQTRDLQGQLHLRMDMLRDAIGFLLRLMDNSSGKKTITNASRRGMTLKKFSYK